MRPEAEEEVVEEEDREVVSEEAQTGGSDLLKGWLIFLSCFLNHININEKF